MKVSIITVSYNSGETIRRAIESVNCQTHDDIEHVLVDGASTDNTLDIIYAHSRRARNVISEPDKGLYDAMNKCEYCTDALDLLLLYCVVLIRGTHATVAPSRFLEVRKY